MKKSLRPITIDRQLVMGGPREQTEATVRVIGKAIQEGSKYLPIRNLAASLATRAPAKNYLQQAKNIYNGFLKRWRYVKDPVSGELVTASPRALYRLVLAGDNRGVGMGLGAGDCDCATAALGAAYESVGFPVRIVTISPPQGPRYAWTHVYPEVAIPKLGWFAADPVLHPRGGFGDIPPHSAKKVYDLNGIVLQSFGGVNMPVIPETWQRAPYEHERGLGIPPADSDYWDDVDATDHFLDGAGDPDQWDIIFREFGLLTPFLGLVDSPPYAAEVDETDELADGYYRTPMIELSPADWGYMRRHARPYDGCLGVSDMGDVYEFDGLKDVWKKITKPFKKAQKKIKSTAKKAGKKVKVKFGKKLAKTTQKVLKPVMRFIDNNLKKFVPVAAFVPGYGPALAAGLTAISKNVDEIKRIAAKPGAVVTRKPVVAVRKKPLKPRKLKRIPTRRELISQPKIERMTEEKKPTPQQARLKKLAKQATKQKIRPADIRARKIALKALKQALNSLQKTV